MAIVLLAIVAFAAAGRLSAQQEVKILNLQDCINIAVDRSTAVLKGNNNVALAGAQVLAAYGAVSAQSVRRGRL